MFFILITVISPRTLFSIALCQPHLILRSQMKDSIIRKGQKKPKKHFDNSVSKQFRHPLLLPCLCDQAPPIGHWSGQMIPEVVSVARQPTFPLVTIASGSTCCRNAHDNRPFPEATRYHHYRYGFVCSLHIILCSLVFNWYKKTQIHEIQ